VPSLAARPDLVGLWRCDETQLDGATCCELRPLELRCQRSRVKWRALGHVSERLEARLEKPCRAL
jgi:hypothetical protein